MTQPTLPPGARLSVQGRNATRTGSVVPIKPTPVQRMALHVFAFMAVLSLIMLSLPVAAGLFLGALLAFSLLGVYERLLRRLGRANLAAVCLSVASALAIVGLLSVFFYFVIERGIVAANSVARSFDPGGPLRTLIEHVDAASRSSPIGPIDLASRVRESAALAASKLTTWAATLASVTFKAALMLFFTIMTMFFVLRHWTELVERAERLLPLHPTTTHMVLAEFQRVGKEVFMGTLLTGIAQGLLATVGYAIVSVPEAALLGALTAICSLVPAIGTLLVWVPVGVALAVSGRVIASIFILAWGTLAVSIVCDYVIRPKLVGRKGHVPTLLTFISLFGGVEVFGLVGLIVGPVIASVALAVLQTYDRELCADAGRIEDLNGNRAAAAQTSNPIE